MRHREASLSNVVCRLCFSWNRCKHRKPWPVSRSTHAGASAGGGDGVPFAEPKKKFAGQQGLHICPS